MRLLLRWFPSVLDVYRWNMLILLYDTLKKMPTIDLSLATYRRLLAYAISFEDTPEVVVSRLLDSLEKEGGRARSVGSRKDRAAPGSILPEGEYWRPILSILEQAGGSAPAGAVIDSLEQRLRGRLMPRDEETLAMGEVRWRNRARFARLRMIEQGLLSKESPRGIWEITDSGRAHLERLREVERSA
jgi:Mrr N-terminal domain